MSACAAGCHRSPALPHRIVPRRATLSYRWQNDIKGSFETNAKAIDSYMKRQMQNMPRKRPATEVLPFPSFPPKQQQQCTQRFPCSGLHAEE